MKVPQFKAPGACQAGAEVLSRDDKTEHFPAKKISRKASNNIKADAEVTINRTESKYLKQSKFRKLTLTRRSGLEKPSYFG